MARVALINPAGVDSSAIADICEASALPEGEIRLIVGDPQLPEDLQGVTIARALLKCAGDLYGLRQFTREHWDCGVLIGPKWSKLQSEYPAYFAYLLGHEFGHATTVLTNLRTTIYEDLVLRYIGRVSGGRQWRWDEMPHEIAYDSFGMAVAESIFGRPTLEREFSSIIDLRLSGDGSRLRQAVDIPSSMDLSGLPKALASFSAPYKEEYLRLWSEDRERGVLCVARGLSALESLWDLG